jgi:hypothetical protein
MNRNINGVTNKEDGMYKNAQISMRAYICVCVCLFVLNASQNDITSSQGQPNHRAE